MLPSMMIFSPTLRVSTNMVVPPWVVNPGRAALRATGDPLANLPGSRKRLSPRIASCTWTDIHNLGPTEKLSREIFVHGPRVEPPEGWSHLKRRGGERWRSLPRKESRPGTGL